MKKIFGKERIGRAILLYILLFSVCFGFLSLIFYHYDKSFIWNIDGIEQHFATLNVYRQILINFLKTGSFNTFYFNIGTGIDLYANLAYYIFGDFFAYFNVFFAKSDMEYFYDFLVFMRIFMVGICFIIYAKYKKISNFSSVISALIYTFSIYSLFTFAKHPFFMNSVAILPLLFLGIEKIVNEDKKIFYVFIIFISIISSFYFSYMLFLILLIYGSILIISKYHEYGIKVILSVYLKVFFYSILGISLAAFVVLPVAFLLTNSSRLGMGITYVYNSNYYHNLLTSLASTSISNWVILGTSEIVLFTIPLALKDYRLNGKMLSLLAILFIPLLFPSIGSIFCGFAFPNHRWSFAIAFIISYLSANVLDRHLNLSKSDVKWILSFNIIYLSIVFLFINDLSRMMTLSIIFTLFMIFYCLNKNFINNLFKKIKLFRVGIALIVIFSLIINIYVLYVPSGYINEFIDFGKAQEIYATNEYSVNNLDEAVKEIKKIDKSFYKIAKCPENSYQSTNTYLNSSLYYDYNSINYFYSIVPKRLGDMAYDLSNFHYRSSREIGEFNYRSRITSLLGVKYLIADNSYYIPYGYSLLKNNIYVNNYPVNFASFYDNYIDINEYEKLSNIEKENSLMKTVAIDKKDLKEEYLGKKDNLREELNDSIVSIPYESSIDSNEIVVSKFHDGKITLSIDEDIRGELYLKIDNFHYQALDKEALYEEIVGKHLASEKEFNSHYGNFVKSDSFYMNVKYRDISLRKRFDDLKVFPYSSGNDDLLINLTCYNKMDGTITIELFQEGKYTFDNMEVIVNKFDDYDRDINNLNRSNFEFISNSNTLKGKVNLEKKGVLQFNTPYSKGWKVLVDGEEVDAFVSNKYFLGIYVDEGKHDIELIYHTPFKNVGIFISIVGFITYCVIIVFEMQRRRDIYEKSI